VLVQLGCEHWQAYSCTSRRHRNLKACVARVKASCPDWVSQLMPISAIFMNEWLAYDTTSHGSFHSI